MTATNHALTGTVIGLLIDKPYLALPLAFLSHFVCDSLPHYGAKDRLGVLRTKGFRYYLMLEASLCFLIVLALAIIQPEHWRTAAVCAFLAASPDLYWFKKYKLINDKKLWKPGWFEKFSGNIQWFQKPIGVVVEAAWFSAALVIIIPFLNLAKI